MSATTDRRVIVCNYAEGTSIASKGAKAYVVLLNPGNAHDRIDILVRSHGGRLVRKYEDIRRLENFRAKTIPVGHPRYGDERLWDLDADESATRLAEWSDYWKVHRHRSG